MSDAIHNMCVLYVCLGISPFLLVFIVYLLCRFVKPPLDFKYDDRPPLIFLYLKAFYLGVREQQGVLKDAKPTENGRLQVIVRDCRLVWNQFASCQLYYQPINVMIRKPRLLVVIHHISLNIYKQPPIVKQLLEPLVLLTLGSD